MATWNSAGAQAALAAAVEGRGAPGGVVVVSVRAGAAVAVVTTAASGALVTIEGWVPTSRLAGALDSFPASVDAKGPLRVRVSASGKAGTIADLRPNTGVRALEKSGSWTRISRNAWIPVGALPKAPPPASVPPSTTAPAAPQGAMSVNRPAKLLVAPGGRVLGELASGAMVQALAHDHGFARVRIEGWIPERELSPADSSLGSQLAAADLRADPEGTRGRTVQWEVEILSLESADPLRPELAPDEPYLLARGPGTENALLYLAVPPSLLNQVKGLAPLTRVLITARVRVGRSEHVGTPILDLKSIARR